MGGLRSAVMDSDQVGGGAGRPAALALVAVCAATGVLAGAVLASAAGGPHGRLIQPTDGGGCLHPRGIADCARARAITSPGRIAVSPDGRHAYVTAFASNAVAVFSRNRKTGALHQLPGKRGCVSHHAQGSCEFGRALANPISVAVSPDGHNVYVAATGSDALSVFARNRRSGALRQLTGGRGCASDLPGGGCEDGRALNEPIEVVVSPDGKRVYVAAREGPSAVAVFTRGRGGALKQAAGPGGCASQGGNGNCTPSRALRTPWDLEVSPDSRHVYVAGSESDGVAILTRTPAGLSQAAGPTGCVARTAVEGCATARALAGALGVALSPDGTTVYVASIDSDALAIFRRSSTTGVLTQAAGRAGCIKQTGGLGCKPGRVLDGVHDAVVSPDGRNVYTVSEEINAMSVFARDRRSGSLNQLPGRWACFIRGGVLGCPAGRSLTTAVSLTVTHDGRNVYIGSADRKLGGVGIFRRLP
jgi:DNA-binding beta-propeller fold protein YncE